MNVLCGIAVQILSITLITAALGPYLFLIGLLLIIAGIIAHYKVYNETEYYNKSKTWAPRVDKLNAIHTFFTYLSLIITAVGVTSIFITIIWQIILLIVAVGIGLYLCDIFIYGRRRSKKTVVQYPGNPGNAGGGNLFLGGVEESELEEKMNEILKIQPVKKELVKMLSLNPDQKITFDKLFEAFASPGFDLEDCIKTCVKKCEETRTQITQITPASFSKVPFTLKSLKKSIP